MFSPDNKRQILHFDLDTFYVSVERLLNSKLKDRPVLVGGITDRGVVSSCSYETQQFGVHSGMAMKIARRLCPEAFVIKGDASKYAQYSNIITEIIREWAPVVEKASVDEFYVDMTGMDSFFGTEKYSNELRDKIIKETHLPISMGLSENKTVSKVAAKESKPNGKMKIDYGREKFFLAPLSVRKLPMVGPQTFEILSELGIKTINTLQQTPRKALENVLGKTGQTLWHRAQGVDTTPVRPTYERKSISSERTFDLDTIDVVKMETILSAMAMDLAHTLRLGNQLTACVVLKIRYSDMQTYTRQEKILYTSLDHILEQKALKLFRTLFERRQLIRTIGITYSNLAQGANQINLEDSEHMIKLYQEMDYLRKKYHDSRVITRARIMEQEYMGQWDAWNGEPPVPGGHRHI